MAPRQRCRARVQTHQWCSCRFLSAISFNDRCRTDLRERAARRMDYGERRTGRPGMRAGGSVLETVTIALGPSRDAFDLAHHPRLVVTGVQAGEVEAAGPVEVHADR